MLRLNGLLHIAVVSPPSGGVWELHERPMSGQRHPIALAPGFADSVLQLGTDAANVKQEAGPSPAFRG